MSIARLSVRAKSRREAIWVTTLLMGLATLAFLAAVLLLMRI